MFLNKLSVTPRETDERTGRYRAGFNVIHVLHILQIINVKKYSFALSVGKRLFSFALSFSV